MTLFTLDVLIGGCIVCAAIIPQLTINKKITRFMPSPSFAA
jgi:hypothetical protein